MMKKLFLFVSVLFLTVSCSDEKLENDLSKENLFGKVKSVQTTKFYAADSLEIVVKNGVSGVFPIILNEYNELGNLVKNKKLHFEYPERYNQNIYSYNNLNQLIEKKHYFTENLHSHAIYTYNEINNLIEVNISDRLRDCYLNIKLISNYDNKNNLIEEVRYEDSIYRSKKIFTYNIKNKITESYIYFGKNIISKKTYDKEENLIEEIDYDTLKNIRHKWTYIMIKKES